MLRIRQRFRSHAMVHADENVLQGFAGLPVDCSEVEEVWFPGVRVG